MRSLPVQSCVIDGEAIVTNDKGLAVFDLLREHHHHVGAELCAFDMIELDGEDMRQAKLEERKRMLARLLGRFQPGIVVNEYFEGDGAIIYELCAGSACHIAQRQNRRRDDKRNHRRIARNTRQDPMYVDSAGHEGPGLSHCHGTMAASTQPAATMPSRSQLADSIPNV